MQAVIGRKIAKHEDWRAQIRGAFMNATPHTLWSPWIGPMKIEAWLYGGCGDLDNYLKEAKDALDKAFVLNDKFFTQIFMHVPFRVIYSDGSTREAFPASFKFRGLEIRLTAYHPSPKSSKK